MRRDFIGQAAPLPMRMRIDPAARPMPNQVRPPARAPQTRVDRLRRPFSRFAFPFFGGFGFPWFSPFGAPYASFGIGMTMVVRCPRGLNVRTGPGLNFPTVAVIGYGQVVSVLSTTPEGWSRVQAGGIDGFVADTCAEVPGGPWLVPTVTPETSLAPAGYDAYGRYAGSY